MKFSHKLDSQKAGPSPSVHSSPSLESDSGATQSLHRRLAGSRAVGGRRCARRRFRRDLRRARASPSKKRMRPHWVQGHTTGDQPNPGQAKCVKLSARPTCKVEFTATVRYASIYPLPVPRSAATASALWDDPRASRRSDSRAGQNGLARGQSS